MARVDLVMFSAVCAKDDSVLEVELKEIEDNELLFHVSVTACNLLMLSTMGSLGH